MKFIFYFEAKLKFCAPNNFEETKLYLFSTVFQNTTLLCISEAKEIFCSLTCADQTFSSEGSNVCW